jgi:hypothetical protein
LDVAITVAPGSKAPFGSVTVPVNVAVIVCANDNAEKRAAQNVNAIILIKI